jgi:hypothetical protein
MPFRQVTMAGQSLVKTISVTLHFYAGLKGGESIHRHGGSGA